MELLLFMTVSASLVILAALLLRPLTGPVFPRITQMILWIAASLRLLIPVRISSPIGIFGRTDSKSQPVSTPVYSEIPTEPVPVPNITVLPQTVPAAKPVATAPSVTPEEILLWVWILGSTLMFLGILFLHFRNLTLCKNKTRDRNTESIVPCTCTVYRCAAVKSPFVYGMLRPRIVLPTALSGDDLTAVLVHETAHIRRWDILKKYLFAAALCVHWFNPLVWLMVYFSAQDMEILCDTHALLMPGAPNAKAYAHALLNAEERRTLFNLGFKSNTEVRIMKILKKDKHNRFLLLISVLLSVLLVTACTTTATALPSSAVPEQESVSTESEPEPTALPAETLSGDEEAETVQTMLDETPAEPIQDLFNRDGVYGFGGLQIGMNWEDAKPIITELTGNKTPVLPETDSYNTYIAFPYSVFGYDGTVTVTFTTNSYQLTEIMCTIPLEGNEAIEAAYNTAFENFCEQFGSPTESYDTVNDHHWYLSDCRLGLYISPIGTTYTEKESVKICIYPLSFEGQPESVPIGETIDTESEAYTSLNGLNQEIASLETMKEAISTVLNTWEKNDEEATLYRQAAMERIGEDASESRLREQIAWLKAEDALGFISQSLPDTEGKECMKISIKREDTDEVLSSHIVPKDEYRQYLEKSRIETGEADVYVSFTPVE